VLLAASTGLRQSELFGLKWGDINFAQGTMNVTRSIVYGVVALQTKSKTQSKSGSNSDLTAKHSFTAAMKYCNGEGVLKDWR